MASGIIPSCRLLKSTRFFLTNPNHRIGASRRGSSFSNARFDKLWTGIGGTTDPGDRQEVMGRLMSILREEGPVVEPYFMKVATAFNERVKDKKMHSTN